MKVLLLVILAALVHAVRGFAPDHADAAATALGAGCVLLAGFLAGRVFKDLGLPRLTGYLTAGIIFGPQVLDVVSAATIGNLAILKGLAVSLLALTAGLEMHLPTIRPYLKSVGWILVIAILGTTVALGLAIIALREFLPFLDPLDTAQLLAVALVLGLCLSSQSPLVVVAIRNEMGADGPVTKTILSVVVFADLVVIVLFAIATTVAKGTFGEAADAGETAKTLALHVGGSMVAGLVVGFLVALYLGRVRGGGPLFVAAVAFVIAEVGDRLHLDPLVVSLAAGIFVRNMSNVTERLHDALEAAGFPVYIAFFALAGAGVHLHALVVIGLPALLFVVIRAIGFYGGTRLAARIAKAPPAVGRYVAFGLMPQAGLSLALATLFATNFPFITKDGVAGADLVFAIVALNELIAPILFRQALIRSGEAGQLDVRRTPSDNDSALTHVDATPASPPSPVPPDAA